MQAACTTERAPEEQVFTAEWFAAAHRILVQSGDKWYAIPLGQSRRDRLTERFVWCSVLREESYLRYLLPEKKM